MQNMPIGVITLSEIITAIVQKAFSGNIVRNKIFTNLWISKSNY